MTRITQRCGVVLGLGVGLGLGLGLGIGLRGGLVTCKGGSDRNKQFDVIRVGGEDLCELLNEDEHLTDVVSFRCRDGFRGGVRLRLRLRIWLQLGSRAGLGS